MPFKTFLSNKVTASKFRVNGLIPSSRLPNKRQLCQKFREHILYSADQLPPKVDLRSDMTPVEDQSRIGSCAANSLAGAYEYLTKKANGRNTDVSRLFIYYNARVKDQKSEQVIDSGCTMTSAIEALEESGTCLESLWPYDISRVNARPSEQSYDEGKRHKITEALRVNINLHEMKSCLAQGFPFAFGLRLYTSFDQASKTGVVPMPAGGDNGRQSHASHALLAVGYSDQSKAFIVRNSWGANWGDQGYCYIPYDYMTNSSLCFDVWAVRKLAADNFGQEHWDINDVVNYSRVKKNDHSPTDNFVSQNHQVIEDIEDDDGDMNGNQFANGSFDSSWNTYQPYQGKNFARNKNKHDYYNINGNSNYNRQGTFNEPWNPYRAYGEDDFADNGNNGGYDRSGSFDRPWNPYQAHRGNNSSWNDDEERSRGAFGRNSPYAPYNQFQANENFFGFSGGFGGFNQFMNNRPDFVDNSFAPAPPFPGYQPYGLNYGYSPPFGNYFNPYF